MGLLTDFKTPMVRHNDDGTVTVHVRFYEGDVTTELEPDPNDPLGTISVTRYRREAVVRRPRAHFDRYQARFMRYDPLKDVWEVTFKAGEDVQDTLKRVLAEHTTRAPIAEQTLVL